MTTFQRELNALRDLKARARGGDAAAAVALREQLEPEMVLLVDFTLRTGSAYTPTHRRILARASQVAATVAGDPDEQQERLIRVVAREMCDSLIHAAQAPAPTRLLQDTICA